jgi:hypothetical protein
MFADISSRKHVRKTHPCGHNLPQNCPRDNPLRSISIPLRPITNNSQPMNLFLLLYWPLFCVALRTNEGACRTQERKLRHLRQAVDSSPVVAESVAIQRRFSWLPPFDVAQMTQLGGASRPSRTAFRRQICHVCKGRDTTCRVHLLKEICYRISSTAQ